MFIRNVVLILFAIQPVVAQSSGEMRCPIHKGTYIERQDVEEKWARHDLSETEALKHLRALDIEYNNFQQTASRTLATDPERLKSLCGECTSDPVARFECSVLLFRSDPHQYRKMLLNSIIPTKDGVRPLGIAQFPVAPLEIAPAFKPNGPAYTYLESLLKLASKRDREAFTKLISMTPYLEGELGEWNSDSIAQMWVKHPELFQSQWAVVRNHVEALANIKSDLSEEQSKFLIKNAETSCKADRSICADIARELRK